MRVRDLKEALNNFDEEDFIIAKSATGNDHDIIEVVNVMRNSRVVAIKLKKDKSMELGVK